MEVGKILCNLFIITTKTNSLFTQWPKTLGCFLTLKNLHIQCQKHWRLIPLHMHGRRREQTYLREIDPKSPMEIITRIQIMFSKIIIFGQLTRPYHLLIIEWYELHIFEETQYSSCSWIHRSSTKRFAINIYMVKKQVKDLFILKTNFIFSCWTEDAI